MLPTPIEIEKSEVPPDLRAEIMRLCRPQPGSFTFHLVLAWAVIVGAIVAAERLGTWWATALAIVVVATRQGQLFLLTHEQVHMLAFGKRWGDLIVNLTCAYPMLFVTTEDYAQVHLAHHRHYFTDKDPDHHRKSGAEWSFPKSLGEIARLALRDVSGMNFVRLIRGKKAKKTKETAPSVPNHRPGFNPKWVRKLFYLALVVLLTATGSWRLFLLYWLLPILTVLQLRIRWGAVCEHEYNRPGASVAESTPLIMPPLWQRALLPNMNFNLHLYHHYFPGVACNNLPRVHELFLKYGLVDETAVFRGYGAYLRHLQRGASAPFTAGVAAPADPAR